MLCWPLLALYSTSKRLPGGTDRFVKVRAAFNIASFLKAVRWMVGGNFLLLPVSQSSSVSASRKLRIIERIVSFRVMNVKRYQQQNYGPFGLAGDVPAAGFVAGVVPAGL